MQIEVELTHFSASYKLDKNISNFAKFLVE